jgi:dTDP-4-dehydrorhamnose 3,5-epimerase
MIDGVILTRLDIIDTLGGDVLHAMKKIDDGFSNFGEAYFSEIKPNAIKAWKCHREMVLNLVVPTGKVRFVLFDDRENSQSKNSFQEIILSRENYQRLTVPPMIWLGMQGLSDRTSLLLNVANILHNPNEVNKKPIEEIEFNWSKR